MIGGEIERNCSGYQIEGKQKKITKKIQKKKRKDKI
jgi:hypothetical protein